MSNNKERKQCSAYTGSIDTWTRYHDKPKETKYIPYWTAVDQCLGSIRTNKLLRCKNGLVLYIYPVGTYAGSRKVKSYSYSGSKCFVPVYISIQDIRHFVRYKQTFPKKSIDRLYNQITQALLEKYDEDLFLQCNWKCITQSQYQYMQSQKDLIKPASPILQRNQYDVLMDLLACKPDEILAKYDLEQFLKRLKLSYLEFERIYREYHEF